MNAKKPSKRIIAVLLSMMLVISCFAIPGIFVNAAGETTVNIYYASSSYASADVWVWPKDGDGAAYAFKDSGDSEKGGVASVTFGADVTEIGFIIRSTAGNWKTKDPGDDRTVDFSAKESGDVDVYCAPGTTVDDFVVGYNGPLTVKSAVASDDCEHIDVVFAKLPNESDGTIEGSQFSIVDSDVTVSSVDVNKNKAKLTLSGKLDAGSNYSIEFGGAYTTVKMPDIFSTKAFEEEFTYDGDDLGANYTKASTMFRVWAPTATAMSVNLYSEGNGDNIIESYQMTADEKGTWVYTVNEDLNGVYYTYTASFGRAVDNDIVDPYARAVGVNGQRGMVIDLDTTNPEGWDADSRHTYANPTDLSIYEVHVRDFSMDPDSGITNKGKYLAFTETGTKTADGTPTGIDHLKDLGITSVHILPSYDYGSVDETKLDQPQFNWGYDPVNYNVPEGSYSTDPYHGEVRVKEYKQMVKALHDAGIGVIMDAVYNHTYSTTYCFNRLVPGYFYRPGQNTSGCGNDVATERSMVRKFIVDSTKYWLNEYHLDGIRFDLMGILDVETMNKVRAGADAIDSNIFLYGEGWDMGCKPTKDGVEMAYYKNAAKLDRIACFSDTIRDGIKGAEFGGVKPGYIHASVKSTVTAKGVTDGVTYTKSWAASPSQVINYQSCHDNYTIWDKINLIAKDSSEEDKIKMNKLGAAIVQTAQGVPFMMSGEEFARTKGGNENSYNAPDEVNLLDYSRIKDYSDLYEYYKGLIAMRKAYPQFRMATASDVDSNVEFIYTGAKSEDMGKMVAYMIKSADANVLVYYNPASDVEVQLPEGNWGVIANGTKAGADIIETISGKVTIPGITALVLVSADKKDEGGNNSGDNGNNGGGNTDNGNTDNGNNGNGTNTDNTNTNTNTGANDNNNNNVNNGDTSAPATADYSMAFVFVAIAAAAGFVAIVAYRKRKFVK